MSYIRKASLETSEERPRSSRRTRRSQVFDSDHNSNNNNNTALEHDAKISGLELPDKNRRTSDSRSPARNRKSKLIETMAANFEKKKTDKTSVSSSRTITNGDVKGTHRSEPASTEPPSVDSSPVSPPDGKKVGPSARRGKMQREKRMLRQKRRSTGVVNMKDVEPGEEENNNEAEKELKTETDANTQSNELSPVSDHSSVSRISAFKSESSSTRSNKSGNESSAATVRIPYMGSSRHHNTRSDESSTAKHSSNHAGVEELRAKLEAAELTIAKLRKDIKVMDNELRVLEEENHQLKEENKMLEDENKTMLRIIRR